ncbi:MAG: fibronectin type III domain-containing protein [bacterium]|nr:fibronectin type III domain-containing protein [bacterium]
MIELSSSTIPFEEIGRVAATAKKAIIRDLVPGETYRVRIRAFNGVRSSKASKKAKFTAKN